MFSTLRPLFESLQSNEVRYVVIGGVAAGIHGVPRATFDLDMLIDATIDNADRLLRALAAAGFGTAALISAAELVKNEITVFRDWFRIDVQTRTPGITFSDTWRRRVTIDRDGVVMLVVSKDDLISAKRASGRPVDLEDVRILTLKRDDA